MNQHLAPLQLFWRQRNTRERVILTFAGLLLVCALAYTLVFAPINRQRTEYRDTLPSLRNDAANFLRDVALAKGETTSGAPVDMATLAQGAGLSRTAKVVDVDTRHATLSGKALNWPSVAQLLADARSQGWTLNKLTARSADGGPSVDVNAEWTR